MPEVGGPPLSNRPVQQAAAAARLLRHASEDKLRANAQQAETDVDSERLFWSILLIIGLTWMLIWVFFVAPTLMQAHVSPVATLGAFRTMIAR